MSFRIAALAISLLVFGALPARPAAAQQQPDTSSTTEQDTDYGSGIGLQILLTNSGFGLGAYYHRAVSRSTSFVGEISLGAGKDERELKFFQFGHSYVPNKANYLLMLPIQAGIVQRLFRESIADNFRPYAQFSAGPTLGWEYPYFDDRNDNGEYDSGDERIYDSIGAIPKGELRFGFGGTIAIGAHFGISKTMTQGVRIGYSFTYFGEGIQLLERKVQEAQHFFGTPTISLTFGKLL